MDDHLVRQGKEDSTCDEVREARTTCQVKKNLPPTAGLDLQASRHWQGTPRMPGHLETFGCQSAGLYELEAIQPV